MDALFDQTRGFDAIFEQVCDGGDPAVEDEGREDYHCQGEIGEPYAVDRKNQVEEKYEEDDSGKYGRLVGLEIRQNEADEKRRSTIHGAETRSFFNDRGSFLAGGWDETICDGYRSHNAANNEGLYHLYDKYDYDCPV